MATTAKSKRPAAKPTRSASPSSVEALHDALNDLDAARRSAQGEARTQLDRAAERLRAVAAETRERGEEELHGLESMLERAGDAMRVEFGLRAIRAQTSTEALTTLSGEIRKRKAEITN